MSMSGSGGSTVSVVDETAEEDTGSDVQEVVGEGAQPGVATAVDQELATDELDGLLELVAETPSCGGRYLTLSMWLLEKPTV
jgi:hypothetical protein